MQRILHGKCNRQKCKQKRKYIFHKEQACRPLYIIDSSAAFKHNLRHSRKIRIKQYHLGTLGSRLAAGSHRNTAIRVLKRQYVINAVTGHRNCISEFFKNSYKRSLLGRRDSSEYRTFRQCFSHIVFIGKSCCIHILLCALYPGFDCNP